MPNNTTTEKHCRFSKQRALILEAVRSTKCHPDAEWVYAAVREQIPDISLGTVYRNLRQLVEQGDLITVETTDDRHHYDGDTSMHAHFVCDDCGGIIDLFLPEPALDRFEEAGYSVRTGKRVLYGLCPTCRLSKAKQAN